MADKIQYIQVPAPDLPQQKVNEVGYMPPTAANPNPSISLKEYFDSQIAEKEKRYEQRFDAQQEAVLKAETATEKRFEVVNEFRETLKNQQDTFCTKVEVKTSLEYVGKAIEKNQADINEVRLKSTEFITSDEYSLRHTELQIQITALRDIINTTQGKTTIADPATEDKFTTINKTLDALGTRIGSLLETRSVQTGSSDQSKAIWGFVVGGLGAAISVVLLILRVMGK